MVTVENEEGETNLQHTQQLRGTNVAGGEMSWGNYSLGTQSYETGCIYRGINRAGAEYGDDWDGWTDNYYYTFPTFGALYSELSYLNVKGFNTIRFPISWERLQHSLNGSLDTTYKNQVIAFVDQCVAQKFTVIVDLHCYGRYAEGVFTSGSQDSSFTQRQLGDGTLTFSHLADVWTKLATIFVDYPLVAYDLMNEPHDLAMTSETFFAGVQTVINAIRATGSTQLILVPNTRGSDIDHWTVYSPGDLVLGSGNGGALDSVAALAITDSANNYAFSVHAYKSTTANQWTTDMTTITSWANTNSKRLFMGEFGINHASGGASAALTTFLNFMSGYRHIWLGWTPWNLESGSNYNVTATYSYTVDGPLMSTYQGALTPNTGGEGVVYSSGTDYLFAANADVDYLHSRDMNFVRLIFSWEVMQETLFGDIETGTYAARFWELIDYITNTKGMYCMIEPHGGSSSNFAEYKMVKVGTSPVTNSAFCDFWTKIAGDTRMKDNPKTIIGLSNEPNFHSGSDWWEAAEAATDAIRDAGFTNLVMIPGFGFTHSSTWTGSGSLYGGDQDTPERNNAYYAIDFEDKLATLDAENYPNGNFCFSTHQYFDTDGGGATTGIVSSSIGVSRAQVIMDWCIANNKRCHISEFAAKASTSGASTAVSNLLSYLDANPDNCLGWAWWGYGPPSWWGGYQFSLCPTSSYTVDSPQMALISSFLPSP